MLPLNKTFKLSQEILSAQRMSKAIVALESTVITHGLPKPDNLVLAKKLEEIVRAENATPATIGVIEGKIHIGMEEEELSLLAKLEGVNKLSSRDIAGVVSSGKSGGTTVAATLRLASHFDISVFATGGIGGVHRGSHWDVSADLQELARQKIILVCAGVKSILDIPATLEMFETLGVPVLGFKTDEFPAFYSHESGQSLNSRVDTLDEVVEMSRIHWQLGGKGILLAVPVPSKDAIPKTEVEAWINLALEESENKGIHGPASTPYLLKRLGELSQGKTLKSNLALLENNAEVAAELASLIKPRDRKIGLLGGKT